jgi:hypothetical protein
MFEFSFRNQPRGDTSEDRAPTANASRRIAGVPHGLAAVIIDDNKTTRTRSSRSSRGRTDGHQDADHERQREHDRDPRAI